MIGGFIYQSTKFPTCGKGCVIQQVLSILQLYNNKVALQYTNNIIVILYLHKLNKFCSPFPHITPKIYVESDTCFNSFYIFLKVLWIGMWRGFGSWQFTQFNTWIATEKEA